MTESSTSFRLKELTAMVGALKSEISIIHLYLDNEGRWQQELDRETKKLERQQARVDLLRRYRAEGWDMLAGIHARLEQYNKQIALLKNEHLIEKLVRLQTQINEINESMPANKAPLVDELTAIELLEPDHDPALEVDDE